MAYDRRPPKGNKFASVDSFEDIQSAPPINRQERKEDFFSGFDNMHSDSFKTPAFGGKMNSGVKGPKIESLESLVAKLAELHFIVKGKVDADNNVELMFCSPEPIVTQDVKLPQVKELPAVAFQPQPEIRYIEAPRTRDRSSTRSKHERRRKTLF